MMDVPRSPSTDTKVSGTSTPVFVPKVLKCGAKEGDAQVKLVAELKAWCKPIVHWFKNGQELFGSVKHTLECASNMTELIIHNATLDDAGVYTVVAVSPSGQESISTHLVIERYGGEEKRPGETFILPQVLLQPLTDQLVRVGSKIYLAVVASPSPEPEIVWYKDGTRVDESEKFHLSQEGGVGIIQIEQVELTHEGQWKCIIRTGYGEAITMCKIKVGVPKGYRSPEFLESLQALLTEQGTVSLECKVIGIPTPILKWYKDGEEIRAGDMFNVVQQPADESGSLGTYTCEAINCMGTAISTAQVTVRPRSHPRSPRHDIHLSAESRFTSSQPVFQEGLEDQTVRVGDRLKLSVKIDGDFDAELTWWNKQGKVEESNKYHFFKEEQNITRLEIDPVEAMDEGEWRCVASGSQGEAYSMCHLTLTVPKNYKKPRFLEELSAILSEEGTVSFECKVVGVPSPMLKWFKDGVELKPGDVYKLTGTKSLGTYACVASNFMGSSTSVTELTLEDLQGKRRKRRRKMIPTLPPQFTLALKDEEVKIGEEMHLGVTVVVPPEPEICWYKDDDKVSHDTKHRLTQDESGTYNLDVFPVDIRDQGEWRCVAINNFGHGSTNCNVKIIVPKHYRAPKFIEELRAALSSEGNVSLDCKVIGVPQPTLTWYKDGVELKAGDIYRIMSAGDGTSCLGTYTCEAKNCMGSASSTVALLAFEDQLKKDKKKEPFEQELSTIEERSEYSSFATPSYSTDNWDDSKAELEFSIYETPDITEDEARQIIEAFAEQVSEHITTSNAAELPPLRFIKESAMVGNVLMEAVIIDVPIECCEDVEDIAAQTPLENLETQAGFEDLSATEALVVDIPYDPVDLKEMSDKGQMDEFQEQARAVSPTNQEAILVQAPFQLTDVKSLSDPEYEKMRSSIEEMESFVHEALRIDSPTAMRADVGDVPAQTAAEELATRAHVGMATLLQTAMVIAPSVLSAAGVIQPAEEAGQQAEVVLDEAAAVQVTAPEKERRDEAVKREKKESTSDEDLLHSEQYDTECDISSIISDADAFDVNEEFAREETSADNALEVQIPDVYSPNLRTFTETLMDDRATPVPPSSHEGVIVEQAMGLDQVVAKDASVQQPAQAEVKMSDMEALQVERAIVQSPSLSSFTDTSSVTLTMADVTLSSQEAMQVQSTMKFEGHEEMVLASSDVTQAEMKETSFKEAVQVQDTYQQQVTDDLEGEVSGKLELPRQLTSPAEELVVAEVVPETRTQQLEVGKSSQELEQIAQEKEVSCLQALIVQEIADLKDSLKEAYEIGSEADSSLADVADVSLNQEVVVTSVDATEMSVETKTKQKVQSEKLEVKMEPGKETLIVEETTILERPESTTPTPQQTMTGEKPEMKMEPGKEILVVQETTVLERPESATPQELISCDTAQQRPITPSQAITIGQDQTFEKTELLSKEQMDVQKAREMLMTPVQSVTVLQQETVEGVTDRKVEGKVSIDQVAEQRIASPIQPLTVVKQELVETPTMVETRPLPATQEAALVETPSKSPLIVETPTTLESTEDLQEHKGLKPSLETLPEVALVRVSTPQPMIGSQEPGVTAEMVEGLTMGAHFEELHQWADEVGLRSTSPMEAVVVHDSTLQPEAVLSMDPAIARVEQGELRTTTPTPRAVVEEPPQVHRGIGDDSKVQQSSLEVNENGVCTLQFTRPKLQDNGEYTCIATNMHGEDATSARLTVKSDDKKSPVLIKSSTIIGGFEGEDVTLTCNMIGRPLPNVTWFKDGVPIGRRAAGRVVATVNLKGTCQLVIHGATMEDNGQYTCAAENALGQDEVTTIVDIKRKHSSSNITDYLPPKNHGLMKEGPIFLTHLVDKIVLLGSTVVLQCEVTGNPIPDVVWLHNGLELHRSSNIRIAEHGNLHTLTLTDVSYSDLGIYSCRASNSFGVTHSTSCLTFGLRDEDMEFGVAAMFITKPISAVSIEKSKDLILSVEVEGEPKPKVTWLKSARDISRSVRAYKDVQGSTHKLVIRNAMLADAGEYTVETSNALGRDSARFMVDVTPAAEMDSRLYDYRRTADILAQLQCYRQSYKSIKELPGPIADEPKVIEVGRNWVTLLWPRPNFDGGSSLLAYKIEAREIPNGVWEEVGLSPLTICDVYNLREDREYEFRVSARNKHGWGEPVSTKTAIKIVKRPHLPQFEKLLPPNVKSQIGSEVILSCTITGYPDPEIKWFKDDCNLPLLPDTRHRFTYDGFTASLIIKNVHPDDSGEYICEASNLGGRLTTFTRLLVLETKGKGGPKRVFLF